MTGVHQKDESLSFSAICYNMGGKSSVQMERFYPILPYLFTFFIKFRAFTVNATEIKRFLKKFTIFFEKIDGFIRKKNFNFFKIAKGGIFVCRMRIKWYYFLENVFSALIMLFLAKNQKIFRDGKIRKNDEEGVFFRKKNVFIFSKAFFTKLGRRKICRSYPAVLLTDLSNELWIISQFPIVFEKIEFIFFLQFFEICENILASIGLIII